MSRVFAVRIPTIPATFLPARLTTPEVRMARSKKSPSSVNGALADIALEVLFELIRTGNPFDPRNVSKAMDEVRKRSRRLGR